MRKEEKGFAFLIASRRELGTTGDREGSEEGNW